MMVIERGPGDSLVCVITNVNTHEGGRGIGKWFLLNGSMVASNMDDTSSSSLIELHDK